MDSTTLEVWLRQDHRDKADILNSRICLSQLRELLTRHLAKMRCAAEWVHQIFEEDIAYPKPNSYYFKGFSELCDEYPELLRDAYIHQGLARAVQTFMIRWYLQPIVTGQAGMSRSLPYTFIKASDNETVAQLLSFQWASGRRFYVDADLLTTVIGETTRERTVLLVSRPEHSEDNLQPLVSANASPVIEQGPRTSRLTETFSDGNLRLPISASSSYLEDVRSHVAVLYLLKTGALFVEYPWCRFGSGHWRLEHERDVVSGTLPLNIHYPTERRDEIDDIHGFFVQNIFKLAEWEAKTLKLPTEAK